MQGFRRGCKRVNWVQISDYVDGLSRDLIISALGGIIVAATGLVYRFHQRWRIQRKFSLKGDYIAYYDDLMDGLKTVVTSAAVIKQKGRNVLVHNELGSGRSWSLEGTLMDGGHISGVYSADASFDEGVGSFYLRAKNHDLDGMWTGYDHENRVVSSGRYWFRKMLKSTIRSAKPVDVVGMLAVSASEFGSGYYGEPDIKLSGERHVSLAAHVNGEVCGFGLATIGNTEELRAMLRDRYGEVPASLREAANAGKLGIIKTVAVRKKEQGRGVGTKIFAELYKRLREKGAQRFIVPAWKEGDSIHIAGVIKKSGFEPLIEISDFWKSPCDAGEFRCVSRKATCNCSAVFFQDS